MTDDVFFAPITELNARLKKREFSAVELVKAFGERLEKLGPKYNALALPLTKIAQKRAKDVDGDLKRERFRGPLQGIPFGAKDLLSFAGHPTTWGAKPYADQVFDTTATVLDKLDDTGSLLIGKLSMVELAGNDPASQRCPTCGLPAGRTIQSRVVRTQAHRLAAWAWGVWPRSLCPAQMRRALPDLGCAVSRHLPC